MTPRPGGGEVEKVNFSFSSGEKTLRTPEKKPCERSPMIAPRREMQSHFMT